jgi:predicted acetyltransferase
VVFLFREAALAMPEPVILRLRESRPADPARGYVPTDFYDILAREEAVGEISLRLVETEYLRLYGGQVGYGVKPEYRGNGYAAEALRLLRPIARAAGFEALWITCSIDNPASRRTLETAGAVFVEEIDLLPGTDMYERGQRRSCRFLLATAG